MVNLGDVTRRQQATWASGDFHKIGVSQVIVGERLCDEIPITYGQRVLDVACGSGNTALAAARRGAEVTGLDYVPALLERAAVRAQAEGLVMELVEGDAQALQFDDGSFDVVLSTFGAMFAPDQQKVADELLRVCRPGGIVGMANWTPGSFVDDLFRVTAQFAPPPPGVRPATEWGRGVRLHELFGERVISLHLSDQVTCQRVPSTDGWIELMRSYYGPTHKTFAALDAESAELYTERLREVINRYNRATDGTVMTAQHYVNVIAVKRG
jgi:SAM-dependent methyltransferase